MLSLPLLGVEVREISSSSGSGYVSNIGELHSQYMVVDVRGFTFSHGSSNRSSDYHLRLITCTQVTKEFPHGHRGCHVYYIYRLSCWVPPQFGCPLTLPALSLSVPRRDSLLLMRHIFVWFGLVCRSICVLKTYQWRDIEVTTNPVFKHCCGNWFLLLRRKQGSCVSCNRLNDTESKQGLSDGACRRARD